MIEGSKKGRMKIMDIKEKIHATTEELFNPDYRQNVDNFVKGRLEIFHDT